MRSTSVFVVALAASCSGPRFESGLFGNGGSRPGDLAGDAGVGASGAAPDAEAPLAHVKAPLTVGGTAAGGTAYGGVPSVGGAQGGAGGAPGGNGGRPGGANGADAGIGSGGAGGAPDCSTLGQKKCSGMCAYPNPQIGCGLTGCNACPAAPTNATAVCEELECAFACSPGYEIVGAGGASAGGAGEPPAPGEPGVTCELKAASGGSSGTGGSPPTECTSNSDCPDCNVLVGPGCCLNNVCGCSHAC